MKTDITLADENQLLERPYLYELRRLSVLATAFLASSDGGPEQAVNVSDETINLLLDGGILSMWRYRILLLAIRGRA